MNIDRFMRKVAKIEFKNVQIPENYTEEEIKYKSLRSSLQKLKPLILWLKSYEDSTSITQNFQKIYDKVSSKNTVREIPSYYAEMSKVLMQNQDNLKDIRGFENLNDTIKQINDKKKILNNKLSLIIHKIEEAINECKLIDVKRNNLRDIQYQSERAYQKRAEYKFDREFQGNLIDALDSMREFLKNGVENTIEELNSALLEFYNLS